MGREEEEGPSCRKKKSLRITALYAKMAVILSSVISGSVSRHIILTASERTRSFFIREGVGFVIGIHASFAVKTPLSSVLVAQMLYADAALNQLSLFMLGEKMASVVIA